MGPQAMCVCHQLTEGKMMERRKKIALELSELVVYCRPVPFDEESKGLGPRRVCLGTFPGRWKGGSISSFCIGGGGAAQGGWALSILSVWPRDWHRTCLLPGHVILPGNQG